MVWQKIVTRVDPAADPRVYRVNLDNCVTLLVDSGGSAPVHYWVTARVIDGSEHVVAGRFDCPDDAVAALDAIVLPDAGVWTDHPCSQLP